MDEKILMTSWNISWESSTLKISESSHSLIFNSNMIVMSRFFPREKFQNNPDPSLHKTCKLFASQRIIEFILEARHQSFILVSSRARAARTTRKNFKVLPATYCDVLHTLVITNFVNIHNQSIIQTTVTISSTGNVAT